MNLFFFFMVKRSLNDFDISLGCVFVLPEDIIYWYTNSSAELTRIHALFICLLDGHMF